MIEHGVGAAHEPRRISVVCLCDFHAGALQFPGCALHYQFRGLVYDLECEFVGMREMIDRCLQGEQIIGADIPLIIGCAFAFQNRLAKIIVGSHKSLACWSLST